MNRYSHLSKEELLKIIEKQEKELDLKKYGLIWDKEKEPEQVVLDCEKNFLKDEGIIFISIGEQELANLNLLCGKIFGHENFLTIMARISKTASNQGKYFAPSCDFVVCYAKNKSHISTSDFYDEVDEDL